MTGANGFVGSGVVEGVEAHPGTDALCCTRRTQPARSVDGVTWKTWDPESSFPPWSESLPPQAIVHLAGRAHVGGKGTQADIDAFQLANVVLTERLAMQAVHDGVRRLVFVSSVGVHEAALRDAEAVTEASSLGPVEPYAAAKLEAERRLLEIAAGSALELVIVRPALVVGRNAPGNLARLRSLVRFGLPVPVPSVENRRSFVSRKNLVQLLLTCTDHPLAAGETFLAAESEMPSTRQVMEWIASGLGRRLKTVRLPRRLLRGAAVFAGKRDLYDKVFGDLLVDASKARTVLGWSPTETLEEAFRALGRGNDEMAGTAAAGD